MTALTSRTDLSADSCLLAFGGEIDCATADDLTSACLEVLEGPARILTLDLGAVRFCDAAALGALIRIRNAALLQDKTLRLGTRSNPVDRLLRLTALDTVFRIGLPGG